MAYNDYKKDMEWANEQFIKTVWPYMKSCIFHGNGSMLSVEKNGDDLYEKLDQNAGIDYMHIHEYHMNGVAVRVQAMDEFNGGFRPYNTFTIRDTRKSGASTEYKKRLDQILNCDIYPRYTLQGYITNNRNNPVFLSGAMMRTKDLYINAEYLDNEFNPVENGKWWKKEVKYDDGSVFRVIPWKTMADMQHSEFEEDKPIKIIINESLHEMRS